MSVKNRVATIISVVLLTGIISCAQQSASAPSSGGGAAYGTLSGNVSKRTCCVDSNFYDYNGAGVELWVVPTKVTSTTTNVSGDYLFNMVTPGTYDVVVWANSENYNAESRTNNGSWGSINSELKYTPYYFRTTKTAVTVAGGEDVVVDFRFWGY